MTPEATNESKKFLYDLLHELKTCVGGMESAFGTLAQGKGKPEMSKKLFETSVKRVNQLLEEIKQKIDN